MTSIASPAAAASPTRPWPAERVEQWPIERLIPYADNPRLHSAADIEKIAASILRWGWTNPVLVDEQGVLIAGHGRAAAAAIMTGRVCCGLEISPAYVDVIVRRWQAFTGRPAIHQASRQSFDERCQHANASGSADG